MPLHASIVGTPIGSVVGTVTCLVNGTIESNVAVPGPQGPVGPQGPAGPAGADLWGQIQGTLSNQTDLQAALDAKYNASNPAGYQTASQVAAALAPYAPLVSPALTGNPTAPTPAFGDNDTSISTTAFVQSALASGTAIARNLEVQVRNQSGSTITAGTIVYLSGATGNLPTIAKAQANSDANSAQTMGFVKADIANNGTGYIIVRGVLDAIDTSALSEGVQLYLSPTTAGTWTTTKPYAPEHLVYVGIVIRSHPNQGTILVAVQNGFEVEELHNSSITSPTNNDLFTYESSTALWKNKSFSTLGLATQSFVTSQGYITSAALSGYATQTYVTSQGYITSSALTPYLLSSTASATYLTITTAGTDYLSKAGNLAGLPSTSTARSNLGLGGSAVADFATVPQSINPTSTTVVQSPRGTKLSALSTNLWAPGVQNLSTALSGTGANAGAGVTALSGGLVSPNVSTVGYATRGFTPYFQSNSTSNGYNFSTESGHNVRIYCGAWASTITALKMRSVFGRASGGIPAPGTLAVRGYGWEWDFSTKVMSIIAHNGTTLTTTALSTPFVPVSFRSYELTVLSDGAGNISMYVDGTLLGTSTGGPTGTIATSPWWQGEIENTSTSVSSGNITMVIQNPKLFTANG